MRRVKHWTEAMMSHAVAEAMVRSKSFARRRFRLSHARDDLAGFVNEDRNGPAHVSIDRAGSLARRNAAGHCGRKASRSAWGVQRDRRASAWPIAREGGKGLRSRPKSGKPESLRMGE